MLQIRKLMTKNVNFVSGQNINAGCSAFVSNNTCCASFLPFLKNCGSDQTGTSGNIQSPNYPSAYGSGTACVWNINAPPGTTINLNVTSFYTENSYDKLFILFPQNCSLVNGSILTGNLFPQRITIPQNTVSLYFYSDTIINYSGFNINWSASSSSRSSNCVAFVNNNTCCTLSLPFVKNCGFDQSGTSGFIQSPNYPSPYNNQDACVWNINAPAGTTLKLNITAFYTEFYWDRLFILLPQSCSYANNGTYLTGSGTPQTISIPQNTASLYFFSDSSVTYSGFNINWSASSATDCISYVNNNACCSSQVQVL